MWITARERDDICIEEDAVQANDQETVDSLGGGWNFTSRMATVPTKDGGHSKYEMCLSLLFLRFRWHGKWRMTGTRHAAFVPARR